MNPYKNLFIDESLMLYKGRLNFKQYIPAKRHRFGVKLLVLCDCHTGFIMDFIIYAGQQSKIKLDGELGKAGSVVMTLMNDYLDKDHVVFVDNWYTSSASFEKLYHRRTGACGTVKENIGGLPIFPSKLLLASTDNTMLTLTPFFSIQWVFSFYHTHSFTTYSSALFLFIFSFSFFL